MQDPSKDGGPSRRSPEHVFCDRWQELPSPRPGNASDPQGFRMSYFNPLLKHHLHMLTHLWYDFRCFFWLT